MDDTRFGRSIQTLAQATGRRNAVLTLGGSGLALLAALGFTDASARDPHKGNDARVQADGKGKNKRKTKRGPAGPAGPVGPAGLAEFRTRLVISENSDPLSTDANTGVTVTADCGGEGKVVSCGYTTSGEATRLVNVVVEAVLPNEERSACSASLFRTSADGANAGARIKAVAICLD